MKEYSSSRPVSKHRGAAYPTWLVIVALFGVAVWQGWINLPTQSLATQTASGLQQTCQLQAGQTLSTTVTASALDYDKTDGVVTVTVTGALDGADVSFAGATGTTADKGSGVAVILSNSSVFGAKVTGAIPCDRDNVALGSLGGTTAKVGLTGGWTNTSINSAGVVLSTTAGNETIGASGVGYITVRLTANRTSGYTLGGTSTGYLTNPNINKFGVVVNLDGLGAGATASGMVGELDAGQMTVSFKGNQCSTHSYKYASNNGYEVGFECAGNLDIYSQGDLVFRLPAISGQNPQGIATVGILPYDYSWQNGQIVESPESLTGTLLNSGQSAFGNLLLNVD